MWARVVELMLGAWLVLTPFVFRDTEAVARFVPVTVACGWLVVIFSLLSYWRPFRRANLGTLVVALVLTGHGYFAAPRPGPPAAQNELVLGLLLLIFAIIPTDALAPPEVWRGDERHTSDA